MFTVKINWNKRYTTIMLYAMAIILALVLIVFLLSDLPAAWQSVKNFMSSLSPIFYGAIFAYLLAPFVNFLERRILRFMKKPKLKRAFSIAITFVVLLSVIALFAWQIVPKVVRGYTELQVMASWYLEAVSAWLLDLSVVEGLLSGYFTTVTEYAVELLTEIYHALGGIIPDIGAIVGVAVGIVMDIVLGVMLSIYYLASKEKILAQMKKLSHALFRKKRYRHFAKTVNLANKNFGGYIKGQIADALILGDSVAVVLSSDSGDERFSEYERSLPENEKNELAELGTQSKYFESKAVGHLKKASEIHFEIENHLLQEIKHLPSNVPFRIFPINGENTI